MRFIVTFILLLVAAAIAVGIIHQSLMDQCDCPIGVSLTWREIIYAYFILALMAFLISWRKPK